MPSSRSASASSGEAWPRMLRSGDFAVVDAARFLGEPVPDVLGAVDELAQRREHLPRVGDCRAGVAGRRRRGGRGFGATAAGRVDAGRESLHVVVAADGTGEQRRAGLTLEVLEGREPRLEAVSGAADQVVDDHRPDIHRGLFTPASAV
jgi:hypothetical protein